MKKLFLTTAVFLFCTGCASNVGKTSEPPKPTGYHYSYFSQSDFFDQAYKQAKALEVGKPTNTAGPIRAIMVNHHLLASAFIAEEFDQIATTVPLTVFLVSPNHFDAGKANVITSAEPWKTPYGILQPNGQLINELTTQGIASLEESPFEQEHGVSGIVSFIKKSLPNATVVPVIFRNTMTLGESIALADKYYQTLEADKSAHYITVGSFDFSHYLTSNAADFHDADNVSTVENFNFPDIYRLDMNSHPGLAFFLELLKNSGAENFHLLENSNSAKLTNQDILETTSYVDGYFTTGPPAASSAKTLLSLGNVEDSLAVQKSLQRTSPQFSIEYLERLLFGQQITVARLLAGSTLPGLLSIDGVNRSLSGNQNFQLGSLKISFINSGRQTDLRAGIEAGADVVVGNGADFKLEQYHNKLIFYGQGDFLTNLSLAQNSTTLALGFDYQNNHLSIYILPIGFTGGKGKLLIGAENGKVLAEMAINSAVSQEFRKQIKTGIITITNN